MAEMTDNNVGTSTDVVDVNTDVENTNTNGESNTEAQPSIEDLLSEIAKLKADGAKNKNALDKALKEKGEITKRLREKQTQEEADAEAKAEAEALRLEREAEKDRLIAEYEAKAKLSEIGLSGKFLDEALEAKISGDDWSMVSVIAKFFEDKYNTALKTKESEWLGNRPPVNVGVGGSNTLTKSQFDKMGYSARLKLANENPELYAQFTK